MDNSWICPNCGTTMKKIIHNPGIYHVCPNCGSTLEGKEQNYSSEGICPNCHQPMGNSNECPYCGYDLGSDFD